MVEVPLNLLNLNNDGFHLLVEVVVYGKSFHAVVDTGASRTVLDKTTIEAYIDEDALLLSDRLSTGLGTNSMESYTLTIPEFKIGGLSIPNFSTAVLDLSMINEAYAQVQASPVLGVLGGDVLMEYKAIINYGLQTLYFATER